MKTFYIYGLICSIDNTIKYIGQAINPILRLKRHIKSTIIKNGRKTKKEAWIQKLINLKIEQNIQIKILEKCNENNVNEREIYYIQEYKKMGYLLTNMAEGGNGIRLCGENHPNFGRKLSDNLKKKLSDCKIGENNPMYGKPNPHNVDWNNNISKSLLNSNKLKKSRNSKEYRDKISKIQKIDDWYLLNDNLEIINVFDVSNDVAKYLGCTKGNVKNSRRDKRKLCKKYWVTYKNDYNNFVKEMQLK